MSATVPLDLDELTEPGDRPPAPAPEWKRNRKGREYVSAQGRSGVVWRLEDESVEEALERDRVRLEADEPPRRRDRKKTKLPPPPAPAKTDLRELEKLLAEVLQAPAMACALAGDDWAANHFTNQGPVLARTLVSAAEHNPWLRSKLEAAAGGDELAIRLMGISTVVVAAVGYLIPPLIWWFNVPVSPGARAMFGIPPPRRPARPIPQTPAYAADPVAAAA